MICHNCRAAGDFNQQGLTNAAALYHAKCEAPGCACEHHTGDGHYAAF